MALIPGCWYDGNFVSANVQYINEPLVLVVFNIYLQTVFLLVRKRRIDIPTSRSWILAGDVIRVWPVHQSCISNCEKYPASTSATPRQTTKIHSTLRLRCPHRADAWPRPLRTWEIHALRPSRNEPLLPAQRMRLHPHGMAPRRRRHVWGNYKEHRLAQGRLQAALADRHGRFHNQHREASSRQLTRFGHGTRAGYVQYSLE